MPNGYKRRILPVNLSQGTLEVEEPPGSFYRKYMGGSAMGMYYVLRDMPPGTEPLAAESVLTLMMGVKTGAPISGQSRIYANARSPQSGAIRDSQSGDFWTGNDPLCSLYPVLLQHAGYR